MSKFPGPHVHSSARLDLTLRYIREVRPSVVKVLIDGGGGGADPAVFRAAREVGALIVARPYIQDQDLSGGGQARMLGEVERVLRTYPQVDVVEGYNEAFQDANDIGRRAEFDVHLMHLAERYGKKAAIGSFSVGKPDLPEPGNFGPWRDYVPALIEAGERGHYVALHEYGGPAVQWGCGPGNQMSDLGPGGGWSPVPVPPGALGWFCLRYRRVVQAWRMLGLSKLPRIIITEFGLDDIQPRPNVGTRRGYKTYQGTPWWANPSVGTFAQQCRWMAQQWEADELVVGGVIFDFGDDTNKWDDFDPTTDEQTYNQLLTEGRKMATRPAPVEEPMADLNAMFRARLGDRYEDLRATMADRPGFNTRPLSGVEALTFHHSAGPKTQTWISVRDGHWNRKPVPFAGIGYHVGIRLGKVSYLGDVGLARACVANLNHRLICVCLMGNFETQQPDPVDLDLARIVVEVVDKFMGRKLAIRGHREYNPTVCPGRFLWDKLPTMRAAVVTPPSAEADLRAVAWHLEELQRKLQAAGDWAASKFIGDHYTADAIRRRIAKFGQ